LTIITTALRADLERYFSATVLPIFRGHPSAGLLAQGIQPRIWFYLSLLADAGGLQPGTVCVDLGAGLSYFGLLARHLGIEVFLVDDFGGGGGVLRSQTDLTRRILGDFEECGLRIVSQDLLSAPLPFGNATAGTVTCFHSIEHWHHSPRRLFQEVRRILQPGGILTIACPNSVNLRKRLAVVAGYSNLAPIEEWYADGDPIFRGHVRELTVRELRLLMEWNQIAPVSVEGRNFIGLEAPWLDLVSPASRLLYRVAARIADPLMRAFPQFCSDIHIVGRKN
jgi:SAM-dependent methyltransferase